MPFARTKNIILYWGIWNYFIVGANGNSHKFVSNLYFETASTVPVLNYYYHLYSHKVRHGGHTLRRNKIIYTRRRMSTCRHFGEDCMSVSPLIGLIYGVVFANINAFSCCSEKPICLLWVVCRVSSPI